MRESFLLFEELWESFAILVEGFPDIKLSPRFLNFPYFLTVYVQWYMNWGYKRCRGDRDVLCLHTSAYISGLMWYCSGIWSPHLCGRTHLHVSTNVYCTLYIVHIYFDETDLNNQKSTGKSISVYGFQKSQEKIRKPKVSRLLPNVCDFQKENHILGYGFKNL